MTKSLVIGGTSGIGAAVAHRLQKTLRAPRGLREVLVPDLLQFDVRDPFRIRRYFEHNGPFDEVVFSAGVNHLMPIGNVDEYRLLNTFEVNVMGFIRTLNALTSLQSEWPCSVVAIVSDSAITPMRHSIAYASSKAALAHAIRCAARELAPRCRVNGISPSVVDGTPMTEHIDAKVPEMRGWTPEQAQKYEISMVPMGRRCTLAEVARLTVDVLRGPEFLTGAIIPITGGK